MKITTARFVRLLKDAEAWDQRHQAMCHAQKDWLVGTWCFGDEECAFVGEKDRPVRDFSEGQHDPRDS